jgi:DNA-binding CsgD family transcriptional regulator
LREICSALEAGVSETQPSAVAADTVEPLRGRWLMCDCFRNGAHQYVIERLWPFSASSGEHGPLSEREHMVARLAARGDARKVIADTCGISLRAVSTHLAGARRKLGAASQADLVRALMGQTASHVLNDQRTCLGFVAQVRVADDWFRILRGPVSLSQRLLRLLTPAEEEILAALIRGLRPAQVARVRATSVRTVYTQISGIMRKTQATSRAELIAAALGIVTTVAPDA